jgi:hypothetical protein
MADIPQVLATYDALVGVALGAGLTYGFGALNRRHQEAREDRTRWYETRLKAYTSVPQLAVSASHTRRKKSEENLEIFQLEMAAALSAIRLVGSKEVVDAMEQVFKIMMPLARGATKVAPDVVNAALWRFQTAARKDLGHP